MCKMSAEITLNYICDCDFILMFHPNEFQSYDAKLRAKYFRFNMNLNIFQ